MIFITNLLITVIISFVILTAILAKDYFSSLMSPSLMSITQVYILKIAQALSTINYVYSKMELSLSSLERILEYINKKDKEKSWDKPKPDKNWSSSGTVEFQNIALKYKEDGQPIIDNLSLKIESGQKIGVVGRIGCGKLTLLLGLLRIQNYTNLTKSYQISILQVIQESKKIMNKLMVINLNSSNLQNTKKKPIPEFQYMKIVIQVQLISQKIKISQSQYVEANQLSSEDVSEKLQLSKEDSKNSKDSNQNIPTTQNQQIKIHSMAAIDKSPIRLFSPINENKDTSDASKQNFKSTANIIDISSTKLQLINLISLSHQIKAYTQKIQNQKKTNLKLNQAH